MSEKTIVIGFSMSARTRRDGRYEGVLNVEGHPEIYVTQSRANLETVARDLKQRANEILAEALDGLLLSE